MTTISNELQVATTDSAKKKMELALTKAEFNVQSVLTGLGTLVLNEDNMPLIKERLAAVDKINKKIDEEHKEGKKPYKDGADAWDKAKNELKGLLSGEYNRVSVKYTQLCQAVETRGRLEAAENKRKSDIQEGINNNINAYSQKIADCTTNEQLIEVERLINLEKTRKDKYAEFFDAMVIRLGELTPLVTAQKLAIKQLKKLDSAEQVAIEKGDDETLLKITEQKEGITAQVQENKIRVQETAVNQSTGYSGGFKTVIPKVDIKRRVWKTALVDAKIACKENLDLLRVELDPEKVKEKLTELKESGKLKEGETEELTIGGIKYFLDKTFK